MVKSFEGIKEIYRNRPVGAVGTHSFFSVLVPIVEKEGKLHLLYEVRADHLDRQPGEICFPGGAVEKGESYEQCAVRETCEELGLTKEDINVFGQGDTVYTYSNMTMFTFIGSLREESVYPSEDEVKEVFTVPLEFFESNEPYVCKVDVVPDVGDFPYDKMGLKGEYNWRRGISEVPAYRYEDRIIWGLTARVTAGVIDVLKKSEGE